MKRVVIGIVDSPRHADITVRRLVASGFAPTDVSVLFPDRHGQHDFAFTASTKAPEGALAGAGLGGIAGALVGLTLALTGLFPAVRPLGEVGVLMLALATAAVGAVVLGIVGAVLGATSPEIEARYYEGKVRIGTILVGVHARGPKQLRVAREALRSVAATDVTSTTEAALPT